MTTDAAILPSTTQNLRLLRDALAREVLGQNDAIDDVICVLCARGHVLLEGVPGTGKTRLSKAVAHHIGAQFARLQLTPDVMPSDVTGVRIFSPETRSWQLFRGPVFTDVLLADEINRTPPKTQSALLEAMGERQVSIDGETHTLSASFFVIATQNPLEFEGTYPLPEAQTDRFALSIALGYPTAAAELALYAQCDDAPLGKAAGLDLAAAQRATQAVEVSPPVVRYVLALVQASRQHPHLRLGASPRAGMMLLSLARARALMDGRTVVQPDDVQRMVVPAWRHRLVLSPHALLDGNNVADIIAQLVRNTPVLVDATTR